MNTRFLYILVGFMLLTIAGMAQSTTRKFTFGLKVGANFSQLDNLSYQTPRLGMDGLPVMSGGQVVYDFFQQNDSRTVGIVGGLFARFGNRVYLQPEVLVSVKGGRFDIIRQGLATQSVDVKIGTIDIPLLLGVRLGPLRVNAGPMASLRVLEGNLKGALSQYTSQPFDQTVNQMQLGYQAGIGITLSGLQLDLRREGGFNSAPKQSSTESNAGSAARATLWQLTVGYGF